MERECAPNLLDSEAGRGNKWSEHYNEKACGNHGHPFLHRATTVGPRITPSHLSGWIFTSTVLPWSSYSRRCAQLSPFIASYQTRSDMVDRLIGLLREPRWATYSGVDHQPAPASQLREEAREADTIWRARISCGCPSKVTHHQDDRANLLKTCYGSMHNDEFLPGVSLKAAATTGTVKHWITLSSKLDTRH